MLQFMGSQRVGHDWLTELNWKHLNVLFIQANNGSFLASSTGPMHSLNISWVNGMWKHRIREKRRERNIELEITNSQAKSLRDHESRSGTASMKLPKNCQREELMMLTVIIFVALSLNTNFRGVLFHMNAVGISSVQLLGCVWLYATPWTAARQASLSITNSQNLLKLMSIELVMPSKISSSVIPFSSSLQSFPLSGSFPMSHFFASAGQSTGASASTSNKCSGLISFRID